LGESASGAAYMAHNVINDHLRIWNWFEMNDWTRGKHLNGHSTMHHTPTSARKSSADRPPIIAV
jgi:hypothetical protein